MKLPTPKNYYYVLPFVVFVSFSCKENHSTTPVNQATEFTSLWTDKTSEYLPVTAEWTNRVEVADLNGDDLLDLIFANGGDYSEPGTLESSRVFINQGPNTLFKEVTKEIFGDEKFYARVIKVMDINTDELPDILIGTTFQTQPQLYLGQENETFRNVTATHFPQLKASIGDLEFGDVDDDGDIDIALSDWGVGSNMENEGGRTLLWLNNGAGIFTDVTATQMPDIKIQFSWDLEFIDFDNDFDLDIAVSCKRCGGSRVFENDGHGYFKNKRIVPAYTNNYEFEAMDVNNDGFLDLVTVNDGEIVDQKSWSRREHLFLSDSGKRFFDASEKNWPDNENTGEDDNNIVFLDVDSDGDPDFLVSSLTGEDRLLINDGTGSFTLQQPVLAGEPTPQTLSLVLGDINNDKKIDIIMGQGEGREGIEERIFMGTGIQEDTAPPRISHIQLDKHTSSDSVIIRARIHDNKSPNMPHDWKVIEFISGNDRIPLQWYGEYLWRAMLPANSKKGELCATDHAGNTFCKPVQ